jgi:glutaconate CoA-transferase, subunit B
VDYPGQYSLKRGDVSFGFSSGAQIDVVGSQNSVCIGDYRNPKVRLVGPVLQPEHMTFRPRIRDDASPRRPHFGAEGRLCFRRRLSGRIGGLAQTGSRQRWTGTGADTKCIFGFEKIEGRMVVQSIHPGVTAEELRQATGFDLGNLAGVAKTLMPDAAELRLLRDVVDPKGLLLRGLGSEVYG